MADSRRAFVVGHPIAHSRSPLLHNHWLANYCLSGSYERVDVAPNVFPQFLHSLRDRGFVGGNVTIPHKEVAWRLVDRRDAAAEAIGAVNTLWFEDDVMCGGNTDAYGFAANLDEQAPQWRSGKKALVLGAGGAARAIIHAIGGAGLDTTVVNRTRPRADDLAARFGCSAADWQEAIADLSGFDLVVNTTSLGMKGQEPLDIDLSGLADTAVVSDIVYAPLETPLLAQARRRGLAAVEGLGMLLHQAVPGFERWFGVRPQVTPALRSVVVGDLERAA